MASPSTIMRGTVVTRVQACVVGLFSLCACHDSSNGGGTPDASAPVVGIDFPPASSLTDASFVTVRGTASDASGVAEVRVNALIATSTDGFATWQVSVPLMAGPNTLTCTARDARGNEDLLAAEAQVRSEPGLLSAFDVALDPSGSLALILDPSNQAVIAADLTTGLRTIVSNPDHGVGLALDSAFGLAADANRLLVVNRGSPPRVIDVDLASGDRTILSDAANGAGPLSFLLAIALDGSRALVTSDFLSAVVAVDLATGDRTIVSDTSTGTGPAFLSPEGIALDGGRALVVDRTARALLAVDLATGDRTILSDDTTGSGPSFSVPQKLALDGTRALVADRGLAAVVAVDLASGARTILSDASVGSGPDLARPTAVLVDGARALVADDIGALVAVDLVSGDRTPFSPRASLGTGRSMLAPRALAARTGEALVADDSGLLAIDLSTGDRSSASDATTGTGPMFANVSGVTFAGAGALLTADSDNGAALLAVELASGDRTIVSDALTGAGPDLFFADGVAFDGTRALVVGTSVNGSALLAVDLANGARTILSDPVTGSGPEISDLRGVAFDGTRALVLAGGAGADFDALVRVDPATGARTILSSSSVGSGVGLGNALGLTFDGTRVLVAKTPGGPEGAIVVAVDLASGDRTVVSDRTTGVGPVPRDLHGIAAVGTTFVVTDPGQDALLLMDPLDSQRVIASR